MKTLEAQDSGVRAPHPHETQIHSRGVRALRRQGVRPGSRGATTPDQALYVETFATPSGQFCVAVDEQGALVATAFGNETALQMRLRGNSAGHTLIVDTARTGVVRRQIEAYFAGRRRRFDLALAPDGSPFQQRVWTELRQIPYGETRSYVQLARTLRTSPRAVGRANATNPICLIVPCHRVIGADGSLTGFAFGEDIKRRLLEHENAVMSRGGNA